MVTAALFTTAKTRKQPKCPLTDECTDTAQERPLSCKEEWKNAICSNTEGPREKTKWTLWRHYTRDRNRTKNEREREVAQSCPTLSDPMDCSLPGSSVHGIFQAIVLGWIAISFSKGSSQPRNRTQVSRIVDRRFTVWATGIEIRQRTCLQNRNRLTDRENRPVVAKRETDGGGWMERLGLADINDYIQNG